MYTNNAIVFAALAACASAQIPNLLPRQTLDGPEEPEETYSSSPECISRVQSWSEAFPTPAPALESAMENLTEDGGMAESGVEGLCRYATLLGDNQASAYTSYCLGMYSYLSSQSSNLLALATSCSDDMGAPPNVITSQLDELLGVYSQFSAGGCKAVSATTTEDSSSGAKTTLSASGSSTAPATNASGFTTTATPSATDAAASASTTVSGNAGPRETGMIAAAALAAGFIGAAVAL